MIEITCPRCKQFWYDNDEGGGRVGLCSRCLDHVRRKRARRGLMDMPFLIVAGMLLYIDVSLIALSALMPEPFAKVMLAYGGLLFIGGMIALFGIQFEKDVVINVDWKFGRWPLLLAICGMVCILASFVWMKK
jgi:hypothetical protein